MGNTPGKQQLNTDTPAINSMTVAQSSTSNPTSAHQDNDEKTALNKENKQSGQKSGEVTESEKQMQIADNMTPVQCLHYAAEVGNNQLIRRAFDAGVDINTPDKGKAAAAEAEAETETDKENRKQEKNRKTQSETIYQDEIITGDFPLHKAVNNDHLSTVELLFFLQADLEVKNRIGSTPLHRACSKGNTRIVSFLVSKGAKIDAVNSVGNTPLHIASYGGYIGVMEILLKHLQSQNQSIYRFLERQNNSGMTVYDYAKKRAMIEVLNQFKRPLTQSTTTMQKQASFSLNKHINNNNNQIVSTNSNDGFEEVATLVTTNEQQVIISSLPHDTSSVTSISELSTSEAAQGENTTTAPAAVGSAQEKTTTATTS